MRPMKRILVALDSSTRAPGVLEAAKALARDAEAKLRLFRAVPVPPEVPWDMLREFPPDGLEAFLAEHAKGEMATLARAVEPAQLDGVVTAIGPAWSAICEAARAYDADLIVLGSHGYGVIDHILGTTAAKVVNHADRSVLVVRNAG